MATNSMSDEFQKKSAKRFTGKVKSVDSEGNAYIFAHGLREDLFSPSSSIPAGVREGDTVEFCIQAVDVVPTGPQCYGCKRMGHYIRDCPDKDVSRVRCYRCGQIGHFAVDCYRIHLLSSSSPENCCGGASSRAGNSDGRALGRGGDGVGKVRGPVVCVTKREDVVVDDDDDDDDDDCRFIVCVKKGEDVKKVEEVEDCFILEFDPTEPVRFSNLAISERAELVAAEDDVCILAEKGQVACKDYPHPRHLCANHLFNKTPHEVHCKMCYCYVCDIPAPCEEWTEGSFFRHCHATDGILLWREIKDMKKNKKG